MTIRLLEIARRPRKVVRQNLSEMSTREILNTLSSGDNLSLISTQPPAEDIHGVQLTRDTLSSGTVYVRKNGPPGGEGAVGKKYDGESFLPGQQSTFDKSMPGTLSEEGVCRDQMIEPVLYSNNVGRVSHIRDPARMDWSDQGLEKVPSSRVASPVGGANTSGYTVGDSCTRTEVF
jgi:hypothetical protein